MRKSLTRDRRAAVCPNCGNRLVTRAARHDGYADPGYHTDFACPRCRVLVTTEDAYPGPTETLPEAVARLVRAWPHWSRAERAKIDLIIDEVIDHLSDGVGNGFIRNYCDRELIPALKAEGRW